MPIERWSNDELAHFVFDLIPDHPGAPIPPLAMFVVKRQPVQLILARLINPNREATPVRVTDLYRLDGNFSTEHGNGGGLAGDRGDRPASAAPSYLSCRRFLRTIGVLDPDTEIHLVPLPQQISGILPPAEVDLEQARSVVATDPLFHQISADLKDQGSTFDLSKGSLVQSADHTELVGLSLESAKATMRPGWANLVLTIDRRSRSVVAGHYTRGEEFSRKLKVYSVAIAPAQRSEHQQTYSLRHLRVRHKPDTDDSVLSNCEPSMWSQCEDYSYAGASEWRVCTCWFRPFFYLYCVKYQQACQTYSRQVDCSISKMAAWCNENHLYFNYSDSFCV